MPSRSVFNPDRGLGTDPRRNRRPAVKSRSLDRDGPRPFGHGSRSSTRKNRSRAPSAAHLFALTDRVGRRLPNGSASADFLLALTFGWTGPVAFRRRSRSARPRWRPRRPRWHAISSLSSTMRDIRLGVIEAEILVQYIAVGVLTFGALGIMLEQVVGKGEVGRQSSCSMLLRAVAHVDHTVLAHCRQRIWARYQGRCGGSSRNVSRRNLRSGHSRDAGGARHSYLVGRRTVTRVRQHPRLGRATYSTTNPVVTDR